MRKGCLALILLLLAASPAFGSDHAVVTEQQAFKVLWSGMSISPTATYSGMADTIRSMGGEITRYQENQAIPIGELADYDLVVLCCRYTMMSAEEQVALVKYVRNGGGLLVIDGYLGNEAVVEPVIDNFGIVISATLTRSSSYDYFVRPATTDRRPVAHCETGEAYILMVNPGAMALAGRSAGASPSGVVCFAALGGNSGKGRVIVINDASVWQSYG